MEPILGLLDPEERKALKSAPEPSAPDAEPPFELTVIVPARNEERNLAACLASLLGQSEPGFALGREWELIVVDDASTDRTRAMADEMAKAHTATEKGTAVTVMAAPELDLSARGGFTGKNNACWAGAQASRGRHLLFTDADTIHEPGSLSRSLREAEKHEVSMLSYSPRQIVTGAAQHLVMPLIFAELASVYPPAQVNDPGRRVAAANGQFLLVERQAYFDIGGHRGVGPSVLEDVALATRMKRAGRGIRLRYAPEAIAARMYASTREMVEGWTKNLAVLMPRPLYLAAWRLLDLLLFFGLPFLALVMTNLAGWQRGVILLLWVRTAFRFYSRAARSHFPARDVAISPFGLPLMIFLLVQSTVHHRMRRTVTWKGRTYNPNRH